MGSQIWAGGKCDPRGGFWRDLAERFNIGAYFISTNLAVTVRKSGEKPLIILS
jgi:hypothetical protein